MSDDLFTIRSKALPAEARVVAFKAVEALSSPYVCEVDVLVPDAIDVDMEAAVGKRATLQTTRGQEMPIHGVIASIELMNQYLTNGIFRVTLRPKLWQLSLSEHSRVFVDQSIPEIIEDVLKRAGFTSADYEMKLDAAYPTLEHVCQYRESSFAFVSRWMERDGIYYYFEHGDDHEKLVITDARAGHPEPFGHGVRFFPLQGHDVTAPPALHGFRCKHDALPAKVELHDYDYIKPSLALEGAAAVVASGPDDIVRYGENFDTPAEGQRLARVRAEELLARREVFSAWGTQLDLHPGHAFSLEEHPRAPFNQKYLVTAAEHFGNQSGNSPELRRLLDLEHDEVYRVELRAIRAAVQFRAPCVTAVPRVASMQNAVVDGEADSQYAQVDEHGRYKVKIKFDEGDLKNGKASMWVRMLQPHGGNPEGFHFPLRKGTEVLLIFLGGDPDRPVIAGVGPNTHKPSPITQSNRTKNVIQTGGLNRFEMEDQDGGQYTTISTPTETTFLHMGAPREGAHLYQNTTGDNLVKIGGDRTIRVLGDRLEHVFGDLTEKVIGDKLVQITGDVERKYLATFKHTVEADVEQYFNSNEFKKVLGDQTAQIEGDVLHQIQGTGTIDYTGDYTFTVHSNAKKHIDGTLKIESDGDMTIDSTGGKIDIKAANKVFVEAPESEWNIAGVHFEHKVTENSITTGEKTEIVLGPMLEVKGGVAIEAFGGAKMETFAGLTMEAHIGFHAEFGTLKELQAEAQFQEHVLEVMTRVVHAKESAVHTDASGVQSCDVGMAAWQHAFTSVL
ncbi:MAG TPA: type VI secretion system tip protein TssI/VgrG [Minicystis sp.]|nr:type VI secretion system tip protein TssI/VgrG [Minicystis sp.]